MFTNLFVATLQLSVLRRKKHIADKYRLTSWTTSCPISRSALGSTYDYCAERSIERWLNTHIDHRLIRSARFKIYDDILITCAQEVRPVVLSCQPQTGRHVYLYHYLYPVVTSLSKQGCWVSEFLKMFQSYDCSESKANLRTIRGTIHNRQFNSRNRNELANFSKTLFRSFRVDRVLLRVVSESF